MSEPQWESWLCLAAVCLRPWRPPGLDVIPVPRGASSSEQGQTQPD